MIWWDVMTRLNNAGLAPVEETYMENYGKILAAQRPEFQDRMFRCAFGLVKSAGVEVEVYLFPDEIQRGEFMDIVGNDPWWIAQDNVVLHFPGCDPAIVAKVLNAIA